MNPWAVIGAFVVGVFVGAFCGVLIGVAGERLGREEPRNHITSVTELERQRARKNHPSSQRRKPRK